MKYFNLFSNILISKGATRALVSDTQRNTSELINLELLEIIEDLEKKSIDNFIDSFEDASKKIALEYIDFLIDREYGFVTEKDWDNNFLPLSSNYDDCSAITNLFIELETLSILDKIKSSVTSLGIKHLVIHSSNFLSLEDFILIDSYFIDSSLTTIDLFCPFQNTVDINFLKNIHLKTLRISNIVFFNCNKTPFTLKDDFRFTIIFIKESLKISSCGKVDLKYFNTNLSKILEASNFNSCLYKKIGIDKDGNIKNCPAMNDNYGNIKKTTIEDAISNLDFKKYWTVTKNEIEICKDCEFRYVCTDCRAYTERTHLNDEGLDVSKPLKCGYDPYKGKWQKWSTSPLKEKALNYYGFIEIL